MSTAPSDATRDFILQASRRDDLIRIVMPLALLGCTYALAAVANPRFLTWDAARLQLTLAAFIGLVGIGQTLTILIGQIDLSIPWNITLSAIVSTNVYGQTQSIWLCLMSALLVGLGAGSLNTLGVAVFRIHSLIWTISVNLVLEGITLVYTSAAAPAHTVPRVVRELGSGSINGIPWPIVIWVIAAIVVVFWLGSTTFGREIYALGNNELAALMSGVAPSKVYLVVFLLSGATCALVGLLLTGFAGQTYLGMGNAYLLIPIAAVVLGGTSLSGGVGGYLGTFVGSVTVVVLDSVLVSLQMSEGMRQVCFGLIILIMMLLFRTRRLS
jgi:ribose transport system permease protein